MDIDFPFWDAFCILVVFERDFIFIVMKNGHML